MSSLTTPFRSFSASLLSNQYSDESLGIQASKQQPTTLFFAPRSKFQEKTTKVRRIKRRKRKKNQKKRGIRKKRLKNLLEVVLNKICRHSSAHAWWYTQPQSWVAVGDVKFIRFTNATDRWIVGGSMAYQTLTPTHYWLDVGLDFGLHRQISPKSAEAALLELMLKF